MPLRRSAARGASRKDEVLPLLGWNGGAEDAAPCSITLTFALHQLMVPSVFARARSPRRWLVVEMCDMYCSRCPERTGSRSARVIEPSES